MPELETMRWSEAAGVAVATIAHPPKNLFDPSMMRDLDEIGLHLERSDIKVVVLRSDDPDFFIAHADLNMFVAGKSGPPPRERRTASLRDVLGRFAELPQISIAEVAGRAIGAGSEVVAALDLRFAARGRAMLGQLEVALGSVPGAGGTLRLPRLMGVPRALEAIVGCDEFDADLAAAYGWVNRALPAEALRPFVDRLARRIASFPLPAIREAKRAVSFDSRNAIGAGLDRERDAQRLAGSDPLSEAGRVQRLLELGAQSRDFELLHMREALADLAHGRK